VKDPDSRAPDRASRRSARALQGDAVRLLELDRALQLAQRRVALLGHVAPKNFATEVARLCDVYDRGQRGSPRFVYGEPARVDGLASELMGLADAIETESPLARLYAERARELALEAEIVASRGTPRLAILAARRYDPGPDAAQADVLANALAISRDAHDDEPRDVTSDDEGDPRSLVAAMRAALGARKLAVRVVITRGLAPLAAVGDGVVQIAAGRRIRARDVERTVLHEIVGHVEPAERAARSPLGLLRVGVRRGSDDQEGYALHAERRAGHLGGARGRELAARHVAARAAHAGVAFEDAVTVLVERGISVELAVQSACRAYRGGGLGREAAYLPALVRVERTLSKDPSAAAVLAMGRVSVACVETLRGWLAGRGAG
jgi:hypothetical protein